MFVFVLFFYCFFVQIQAVMHIETYLIFPYTKLAYSIYWVVPSFFSYCVLKVTHVYVIFDSYSLYVGGTGYTIVPDNRHFNSLTSFVTANNIATPMSLYILRFRTVPGRGISMSKGKCVFFSYRPVCFHWVPFCIIPSSACEWLVLCRTTTLTIYLFFSSLLGYF